MEQTIYCPKCKRAIGTYDGRTTIDKILRCKKCRKRIIYHVATGEREIKKIPKRTTASGMAFR